MGEQGAAAVVGGVSPVRENDPFEEQCLFAFSSPHMVSV